MRRALALPLFLVAAAGVWIMYAPTLGYGFDYDDYHGGFREPARVQVELDGRIVDDVEFRTGEWRASTVVLGRVRASPLRKMHRVVLRIDHTWTPSVLDARSPDTRSLGLQVGELQVR